MNVIGKVSVKKYRFSKDNNYIWCQCILLCWRLPLFTLIRSSRPFEHMGGSHLALVTMWLLANRLQIEIMCAITKLKYLIAVVALFSHCGNKTLASKCATVRKYIFHKPGWLNHCMIISCPGNSLGPTEDVLWTRINLCWIVSLKVLNFFVM